MSLKNIAIAFFFLLIGLLLPLTPGPLRESAVRQSESCCEENTTVEVDRLYPAPEFLSRSRLLDRCGDIEKIETAVEIEEETEERECLRASRSQLSSKLPIATSPSAAGSSPSGSRLPSRTPNLRI